MSAPKVGRIYFACTAKENGGVEMDEWHVRTVKAGKATAILKIQGITWVKLSTKHFDWGWAKSIPSWMRWTWPANEPTGLRFYTTKRQAYKGALHEVEEGYVTDDPSIIAILMGKLQSKIKTS